MSNLKLLCVQRVVSIKYYASTLLILFLCLPFLSFSQSGQIDFCGILPPSAANSTNPDEIYFDRFGNSYDIFGSGGGSNKSNSGNCYNPSRDTPTATYSNSVFEVRFFLDNPDYTSFQSVIEEVFDGLSTIVSLPNNNCSEDGISPLAVIDIIDCPSEDNNGLPITHVAAAGSAYYLPLPSNPCGNNSYRHLASVFESVMHSGYNPTGGPSGVICLNDNFNASCSFDLNPDPSAILGIDLRSVILHEMLHVFGFAASPRINNVQVLTTWDLNISYSDPNNPPTIPSYSIDCTNPEDGCYQIDLDSYPLGLDASPCGNPNSESLVVGNGQVTLSGGGDFSNDGLNNPTNANAASHLCDIPGENTVMVPGLDCGEVRRNISTSEFGILSDLGFDVTGLSPSCVQVAGNDVTLNSDIEDCCGTINNYSACLGETISINFSDLFCNDFTSDPNGFSLISFKQIKRYLGAPLLNDNVIVDNINQVIILSVLEIDGESIPYEYVIEGCPCRYSSGIVEVLGAPCFDCTNSNECNNLTCMEFDNLTPGSYGAGFNDILFSTSNSSLQNSPDIMTDLGNSNNYIGVATNLQEGFTIPLEQTINPGCKMILDFNYGVEHPNNGQTSIHLSVSEERPCFISEALISSNGESPTTCSGSLIYDPILIQTITATDNTENFQFGPKSFSFANGGPEHYIQEWTNDTDEPINYITVLGTNGSDFTWFLLDEITITEDCSYEPLIEIVENSCTEYEFSFEEEDIDGLNYEWEINLDGNNVHTNNATAFDFEFAENGDFEIVLTITDECGNTGTSTQTLSIDCGGASFYCDVNVDYIIDANVFENISDWLEGPNNPTGIPYEFTLPPIFWEYKAIKNLNFLVVGNIKIDESVGFSNCNIFFENNSGFETDGGDLWVTNSSDLSNCDNSWDGLIANNNDMISIHNSALSGAKTGVEYLPGSYAFSTNSTFEDNRTALQVIDGSIINFGLNNLTFESNSTALSVYNAQNFEFPKGPFGLTFFDNTTINNSDNAIDIFYSSNIVLNDFKITNTKLGAIWLLGVQGQVEIKDVEISNIQETGVGIYAGYCEAGEIIIDNVSILGDGLGFQAVENTNTLNVSNLECQNNNLGTLLLRNNDFELASFYNSEIYCGGQESESCISIVNSSNVLLRGGEVIGSNQSHPVVTVRGSDNVVVEELDPLANFNGDAFYSNSSSNLSVRDNRLIFQPGGQGDGFVFENVSDGFVCGNRVNGSQNSDPLGFEFKNTRPIEFVQNQMEYTDEGLKISGIGFGDNSHNGNLWLTNGDNVAIATGGPDVWLESIMETNISCFGGSRPTDAIGAPLELWFRNDNTAPCHTFVDCATIDNRNPWATKANGSNCLPPCTGDPVYPDCEYLLSYLEEKMNTTSLSRYQQNLVFRNTNVVTQIWQSILNEFNLPFLELDPDCINTLTDFLSNYEGEGQGNNFYNIQKAQSTLNTLKRFTANHQSLLKTHLNQNKQLYNQRQAIDPVNEEAYNANDHAIKEQLLSIDNILQAHHAQIENRKNELFVQIGNIQTSDEFEENHKSILKIQYKLIDNDINDLENYEWNILASIANKCGYEYGQPVYIARNLIYEDGGLRPDLYNDEFLCTEISERNSSSFVTAFPNPAQDQITVTLKEGHNFDRIVIKDINNKNIAQKSIGMSTGSIDLNTSEYFSGIYFLYLSNSHSKEFEVLKIIKI